MRAALLLVALSAPARAECPVDEGELRRLVDLELGDLSSQLQLHCSDGQAELRIGATGRIIDLAATPASARARLIALAASELLREPIPKAPPTTRRSHSETAMFKRLLAVTLVVTPVVSAVPPPKKSEAPIEARPVSFSRPPQKSHEAPAPELRAEDVFNKVGAEVHAVTDAQIKLLVTLYTHTSDGDPDRPDLQVRLGDLFVEEQRYHRFRARTLDQKIFDAGATPEAARLRAVQADEGRREQAALHQAVKHYLEVANGPYPNYQKMDEVLFDLGRLLREAKRDDAARTFWKRLVKDYPMSRYVPDGLLAFGDDAFERRDLSGALGFYEKVMSYSDSSLAEYARYKTGWCFYNMSRFKDALQAFVTVIEHAQRGSGRLALEREARKDTVRAYAQVGAASSAWPFFQRVGGDAAPAMLEQLAAIESDQGKFLDANRLYRQLMALSPSSLRLCAWQVEVARNTLAQGGSRAEPEAVRELERLAAVQARVSQDDCRDTTAGLLRELATVWHQEAQRTGQLATYQRAGELYRQYLKSFPKAPDVPLMNYYYAELLYKLERYCEAAPLYSEVIKNDPRHHDESAFAQVLSWRACLKLDDRPPAVEASRHMNAPPRAIPEPWRKMIDAFEVYLKTVKSGSDRVRVQYQEGLAYYQFDHCDEAIPIFGDLARHHQESELAVFAADLLFDCHAQKADKTRLRADTRELCAASALTGPRPDFARRCGNIELALGRDEAETLESEHRYKEAADRTVQLAGQHPDDARLDELFYNAGINYQRANMVGLSILAFQELMRVKPDSPLTKKAMYSVGRSYQNIAAFDAAAENYEKFAARWPNDKEAATALYRASMLRRGLGDTQRSLADTHLFLQRYGARPDLVETSAAVAFGEGQIYERDSAKLAEHLRGYLRDWGERGGVDREVIAHVKLGEIAWRASCPIAGESGSCIERRRDRVKAPESCGGPVKITVHARKPELALQAQAHFAIALKLAERHVSDETRAAEMGWYAAQARMLQADAGFERFLALQLPSSQKRLIAWFGDKTRDLERARKDYENVILMKQAHWAIAAAGRVGQMFQIFAAQLNSSPLPPAPPPPRGIEARQWKDDFKNAYCDQLAGHVVMLEDKAEDALKACLDKSTSLSWFNEWSALCEAELNQLKPRSYPLAAELRAEPRFVSATVERVGPIR